MQRRTNLTNDNRSLLDSLVCELGRGIEVIRSTDDAAYVRIGNASSSVGAQFRHVLDFVSALLRGIDSGFIDYSDRLRDLRIETQRCFAIESFDRIVRRLNYCDARFLEESVLVRSEIDSSLWFSSSLGREVEFVHSHTVHHHALIAEKLSGCGTQLGKSFGVAPSTIRYWERKAA